MFQVVPPPIIRSSKLYIQFWAPDDWQRNCLKHVEHFTEINCVMLHLVGYTWKYPVYIFTTWCIILSQSLLISSHSSSVHFSYIYVHCFHTLICMFSLTLYLHFVLCPLRLWKDPMITHLQLISPCSLNSSVGVYMAEFWIVSAGHNWLVRRGGLIILHSMKGTCEVMFDWQREKEVSTTFCDGSFLTILM